MQTPGVRGAASPVLRMAVRAGMPSRPDGMPNDTLFFGSNQRGTVEARWQHGNDIYTRGPTAGFGRVQPVGFGRVHSPALHHRREWSPPRSRMEAAPQWPLSAMGQERPVSAPAHRYPHREVGSPVAATRGTGMRNEMGPPVIMRDAIGLSPPGGGRPLARAASTCVQPPRAGNYCREFSVRPASSHHRYNPQNQGAPQASWGQLKRVEQLSRSYNVRC